MSRSPFSVVYFISFQKQEKYKDAEQSALDLFKEMHSARRKVLVKIFRKLL
jgi:hypothetical protein